MARRQKKSNVKLAPIKFAVEINAKGAFCIIGSSGGGSSRGEDVFSVLSDESLLREVRGNVEDATRTYIIEMMLPCEPERVNVHNPKISKQLDHS